MCTEDTRTYNVRVVGDRTPAQVTDALAHAGCALLQPVLGDINLLSSAGAPNIFIYDPSHETCVPEGAVVLGVGVHGSEGVARLLERLGHSGAAALVVRAPVDADHEVLRAYVGSGVALVGLASGASWGEAAEFLRSMPPTNDARNLRSSPLRGGVAGDLFAIANAVGALVDAPVTIEDRHGRVLAFSGRQDEADHPRLETILDRQVPERFLGALEKLGVFRALHNSERPIFVELHSADFPEACIDRTAVAIRAGDDIILGSMWAALHGPLTVERERSFSDAAKLVALNLLRAPAEMGVEYRLRSERLAAAFGDGLGAVEAVGRLGLADRHCAVLALGFPDCDTSTVDQVIREETNRRRIAHAFALHLSSVQPHSAVALIDGITYGLLSVSHGELEPDVLGAKVATEFLARIGTRHGCFIGIGRTARSTAEIRLSRGDAARALRVLQLGYGAKPVVRAIDVQADALLIDLRETACNDFQLAAGPIGRLTAYDEVHGSSFVATLRAWLDTFGDVNLAAKLVHVHPNTFRYRLRRLSDVGGIDLSDPSARFGAMLELRLLQTAESPLASRIMHLPAWPGRAGRRM